MKFLADASVLGELTRFTPEERVAAWLREHERELTVNPIIQGEVESGRMIPMPTRS